VAGGRWTAVASNLPGPGGLIQVTDPRPPTQPEKFYRVRSYESQ
jgi:hypothetical protein